MNLLNIPKRMRLGQNRIILSVPFYFVSNPYYCDYGKEFDNALITLSDR